MKTPNHVMVLDHDPFTAKLCKTVFENIKDYALVASSTSLREAMINEDRVPLDLLITETKINGQSGLRYTNGMLKRNPRIKVLVVSSESDFELIKQAFKIGVHGYLTKPITPDRLQSALQTIAEEGTALSNDVSSKIISVFREKRYPMLSKRENQIIGYLGEGATYRDIAKKLFVTPSTVNFHLQNIYLKLNVKSKSEALHCLKAMGAPAV
ncbi:MAG: response regulator transcription factor [Bacteroidota bacterium]